MMVGVDSINAGSSAVGSTVAEFDFAQSVFRDNCRRKKSVSSVCGAVFVDQCLQISVFCDRRGDLGGLNGALMG